MANRQYKQTVAAERMRQKKQEESPQKKIERMKTGAPITWTEEQIEAICDRIAKGETLITILEEPDTPTFTTFFNVLNNNNLLLERYKNSRQISATVLVEKTLKEAEQEADPNMAALLRVKSDSRRWAAARFAPETFGDIKRLEVSGEVRHAHVLSLPIEQRRRIAEEWLMSAPDPDGTEGAKRPPILIEGAAETTGPDPKPKYRNKPRRKSHTTS